MTHTSVTVTRISPAIGAVIEGVDISDILSEATVREIRQALLEHLVIFFRRQVLTPKNLVNFAHLFGEIGYYPFVQGMDDQPEVIEVIKKPNETINFGGLWHTDTSYLETPPMGSILYAKEVPPVGGDTLFSNMYMAYEALPIETQTMIESLRGINSAEKPDAAITRTDRIADHPKEAQNVVTTACHPLVRTHPETGRKALYCSKAHTVGIQNMEYEQSESILESLYTVQQREEFHCRFRWDRGSVAFWDNRCSQHNALNDYHGYQRVMHRVTLEGDKPF